MGGAKKQAELSLLAKVDEQTINRSIKALRDLQVAERGVADAAERQEIAIDEVNDTTRQYINSVRQSYTAMRQEVENRRQTIQGLDQEASKRREVADAAEVQARSTARASQQGRGGADFGRIGAGANSIAALLPGGAGDAVRTIGDLAGVVDDLPRAASEAKTALAGLGVGVGELAVAAPIAGLAIAAMVIAFNQFAKQVQEAQANLDSAFDAQVNYYRLIKTGTSDSISAELEKLKIEKYAREQTIADTKRATEGLTGFAKVVADVANALGFGSAKSIIEAQQEINKFNYEIDALSRALKSPEVKARDAAEAAKEAAKETEKSTRATTESTKSEARRTEVVKQQTQAANALNAVLQSVNQKQRDFVATARKVEQDRQKAIADVNQRYREQAIDAARQFSRDEAAAKRQGALEAARLGAERDFAALADLRDQQVFDAQERRISAQESAEDRAISKARDLTEVQIRTVEAQTAAAKAQLEFARQAIAEYFRARGLLGDTSRFSDAQALRTYQQIGGVASTAAATGTGTSGFGPAFGGRAPAFGNGAASNRGVTVNVSGNVVNDARAIADIAARETYNALNAEID